MARVEVDTPERGEAWRVQRIPAPDGEVFVVIVIDPGRADIYPDRRKVTILERT